MKSNQSNRRSFFKDLALGIVALGAAPAIFTPKIINPTWKETLKYNNIEAVPNPEWFTAPYEIVFLTSSFYGVIVDKNEVIKLVGRPQPFPRIRCKDKEGKELVYKYKQQPLHLGLLQTKV